MPARDFDRWVVLTLTLQGSTLQVAYRDETGRHVAAAPTLTYPRLTLARTVSTGMQALDALVRDLHWPQALARLLDDAMLPFDALRSWSTAAGVPAATLQVPWLLPVFVEPPVGLAGLPWEPWLEDQLSVLMAQAFRCVLIRHQRTKAGAEAPTLPLTLLDQLPGGPGAFVSLRDQPWFANEPALQAFGLRLLDRGAQPDAIGTGALITLEAPGPGQRLPGKIRPLLRVQPLLPPDQAPMPWPRDCSTLRIARAAPAAGSAAEDTIGPLVLALAHDFALHEIAWILARLMPRCSVQLASDAAGNQSLRLSRTLQALRDHVRAGLLPATDVSSGRALPVDQAISRLVFDFGSERRGLTSMARLLSFPRPAAAATRQPPAAAHLGDRRPAPPRRVDMTLDGHDAFGVPVLMKRQHRQSPLRCGWRYRLAVFIGTSAGESSAIDGAVPAIDPLLPEIRAGQPLALEVCVYAKSFRLLGAASQVLLLPRAGPSLPVSFDLCAPADAGLADLRVVLYHQNNLLQSFVLRAEVEPDGPIGNHRLASADGPARVSIRLASAGVESFDDLTAAARRAISVAVNDDARPGEHTLMIKGDGARIENHATDADIANALGRYRTILQKAGAGAGFGTTVRDLAVLGRELWKMLEAGRPGGNPVLASLRTQSGQVAQFVRHGRRHGLPWQTVFDLNLPRGEAFKNPRICLAQGPVRRQPAANELGCPHCPGEAVICIEGFWAVRHRLELVSEDISSGDAAAAPSRAQWLRAPAPHPLLVFGDSTGVPPGSALARAWARDFGPRFHALGAGDAPVAAGLWQPQRQPAMLALLSHLHAADPDANEPQRLYAYAPKTSDAELSVDLLLDLRNRLQPWPDPVRPLVLLLACQSARQDLGELTQLSDTFLSLGASAVVGSEWDVLASHAARLGRHLAQAILVQGLSLGEAMRRFHAQEMVEQQPMPLLFTAYGNADLRLQPSPTP